MRPTNPRPESCSRCGAPEVLIGHYCWDETRARAAIIRAICYFTESPDRCDMEGSEERVADEVLARLKGDNLIPGRWDAR